MELNYQTIFMIALSNLIDTYGGSIEIALDECAITNEDVRKQIKEDFGWEEEPDEIDEEEEQ